MLNWKEDSKIITNSICLNDSYNSNCFSTNQETIIIEFEEAIKYVAVYRKNPCVFPFKYLNKTYNSCTRKRGEGFWCATSVNDDSDMENWGFCNDLCPLEGTVQVS